MINQYHSQTEKDQHQNQIGSHNFSQNKCPAENNAEDWSDYKRDFMLGEAVSSNLIAVLIMVSAGMILVNYRPTSEPHH
jgi:hypothetical protein